MQKDLNYFMVTDFSRIGDIKQNVQAAAACITTPKPTTEIVIDAETTPSTVGFSVTSRASRQPPSNLGESF